MILSRLKMRCLHNSFEHSRKFSNKKCRIYVTCRSGTNSCILGGNKMLLIKLGSIERGCLTTIDEFLILRKRKSGLIDHL